MTHCDAAITAAAAAVTYVQILGQEVGSGDEGLGLFGFDLSSSAETDIWCLEEKQEEEEKPNCPGVLTPAQNTRYRPGDSGCIIKLEDLSAAPDKLHHACQEA